MPVPLTMRPPTTPITMQPVRHLDSPSPLRLEYLVTEQTTHSVYSRRGTADRQGGASPPPVLQRINSWAAPPPRPGLLPPIKHRLDQTLQALPVIPPIGARGAEERRRDEGSGSSGGNRESSGLQGRIRERSRSGEVGARNSHLVKLYAVSLVQLVAVLGVVVLFTEIKEVRDFTSSNGWLSRVAMFTMLIFMICWVTLAACFPALREHVVYHLAILLVFTTCEGFLLGALSANANNTLNRGEYRGKYSLKKIDHLGESTTPGNNSLGEVELEALEIGRGREEEESTSEKVDFSGKENQAAEKHAAEASASEELDFDGKENVAAEKHAGVGLHVGRGLVTLRLSTASISVLLCLVVCLAAVLFCLQSRYDGDYLGGLVHAFLLILMLVQLGMMATHRSGWPRLWYGGLGAFFLWFFHRMVVFPLVAELLPYTSVQSLS